MLCRAGKPVPYKLKDTALKSHWTHWSPLCSLLFILCLLMLFPFSCTPSLEPLFHSVIVFSMKPATREVCGTEPGWVMSQSREQCRHYQVTEGNFSISCLPFWDGSHTRVTCLKPGLKRFNIRFRWSSILLTYISFIRAVSLPLDTCY